MLLLQTLKLSRVAATVAATVICAPIWAGTITGGVAFPGDNIPALTVVAVDQATNRQFQVSTRAGQRSYRIDVPQGRYLIFAIPHGAGVEDEPGQPALRGAYSAFSLCVLSSPEKAAAGACQDHELLSVDVTANGTRKRIDLYDWYLPDPEKNKILAIKVETP